jgi:hypothetical protein
MVAVVAFIVYMERAQRRIPVQYAKLMVGRKVYGGQSTYLPLRVNTAGVIPVIFASSLMALPATAAQMFPDAAWLQRIAAPGMAAPPMLFVVGSLLQPLHPDNLPAVWSGYGGFIPASAVAHGEIDRSLRWRRLPRGRLDLPDGVRLRGAFDDRSRLDHNGLLLRRHVALIVVNASRVKPLFTTVRPA